MPSSFNLKKYSQSEELEKWYNIDTAQLTTDPIILHMILKKNKDDYVSRYASMNPNCSPETLKMVLDRNDNDEVSRCAAENTNCPQKDKIQWMRNTNQITQEDLNKDNIMNKTKLAKNIAKEILEKFEVYQWVDMGYGDCEFAREDKVSEIILNKLEEYEKENLEK